MEIVQRNNKPQTQKNIKAKTLPALKGYSIEELQMLKTQIARQMKERKLAEVKAESNELKQKYPNPWLRTAVNLWLSFTSLIKGAGKIGKGLGALANQRRVKRFGLDIAGKSPINGKGNKYDFTISPSKNTLIDYKVITRKEGEQHKETIVGYQTTLENTQGKKTSIFIDANSKINKNESLDLLNGRSIKISGDKWLVPNLNDKDPNGNIKLKEIEIINFDVKDSLVKKFGNSISKEQIEKLANGLESGKRMDFDLTVGKKTIPAKIEVAPMQREFKLFNEKNQATKFETIMQTSKGQKTTTSKSIGTKKTKILPDDNKQNGQFRKIIMPKS